MTQKNDKESEKKHSEKFSYSFIVETCKGSRNKFKFDPELHAFKLSSVLPAGLVFPFDFGFLPQTEAPDGDPLDVLLLLDAPVFPGCYVCARVVGELAAEQTSAEGKTVRNDRLIAVAEASHVCPRAKSYRDLIPELREEIEHFFVSYNEARGRRFKVLGWRDAEEALRRIQEAREVFQSSFRESKHAKVA